MRKKAFTMIELIMVMILSSILSVALVVKVPVNDETKIFVQSKVLLEDIRYAVNYAVNTGIPVRVDFDLSGTQSISFFERSTGGSWVNLKTPDSGENYVIDFTQNDYDSLDISSCDFNGGTSFYIDSMGTPLDSTMTAFDENTASIFRLNSLKQIDLEPVTARLIIRDI